MCIFLDNSKKEDFMPYWYSTDLLQTTPSMLLSLMTIWSPFARRSYTHVDAWVAWALNYSWAAINMQVQARLHCNIILLEVSWSASSCWPGSTSTILCCFSDGIHYCTSHTLLLGATLLYAEYNLISQRSCVDLYVIRDFLLLSV